MMRKVWMCACTSLIRGNGENVRNIRRKCANMCTCVSLWIGYWDVENESEQHGLTWLFLSLHPCLSPSHALTLPSPFSLSCVLPFFPLSLSSLLFFPLPICNKYVTISAQSNQSTTLHGDIFYRAATLPSEALARVRAPKGWLSFYI